jgi:uncharacterized membrane protein HdeD (DUF308 family)
MEATPVPPEPAIAREARGAVRETGEYWWVWLVAGIAWTLIALVILQFDQASITTVGVIVGIMFFAVAAENFFIFSITEGGWRWVVLIFGILMVASGVVSLISPENTFAALADILGFIFFIIGTYWILQAFVEREVSDLWWLTLMSGILMVILGFWTAGQFFIEKAYVLLVFAGIWALTQGITDIVRAFQIRKLKDV